MKIQRAVPGENVSLGRTTPRTDMILIPHQCMYGHTWEVSLRDGYYYDHPSRRFCLACLEWGRIEVGSIQLETSGMTGGRIEYVCPEPGCQQRTMIALPIDHVSILFCEASVEDLFERKPRWHHLPKHWPTMCEHDLRR